MRAIEAARRPLHTVTAGATLEDVARLMAAEGLRAVVVQGDNGQAAGIVSERDLVVRVLARRLAPSTEVDAVMTPDPVTAEATGPVSAAYRLLREFGVRQIPLVHQGRVVAIHSWRKSSSIWSRSSSASYSLIERRTGPSAIGGVLMT